ncbi:MAG: Ig-like domain-containing protein [Gemmatimonadota bacterium]|nr:MAG: Ig-like domain-containing protein [Gemmatimonadota bacterium]
MAGAARSTRRKAASLGLLTLVWVGCAKIEDPPGGPPDFAPPVLLSVTPDSGAVVDGFDDELEFQFDEVISERSGSGLENLILMSPRSEELKVSWKRTRVTVRPKEGWGRAGIYHVTLLPGIADLRNNRLDSSRTVIFSTGGPIPDTRVGGTVIDWEEGRVAARALVEAILLPDSLVYDTRADSLGGFELVAIPPGDYLLFAILDENNNRLRDRREAFDSVTAHIDSVFDRVFWTFSHDTTGPRIRDVTNLDSVTIRVAFNQMLQGGEPSDSAVQVYALPDTTPVPVVALWTQQIYDSVSAVEAAIADSILAAAAADTVPADSLAPTQPDSLAPDTIAAVETTPDTISAEPDSLAQESARIDSLLAERPVLSAVWYVRIATQLTPGARYLVVAIAANLLGIDAESMQPLIVPEPEPPDST